MLRGCAVKHRTDSPLAVGCSVLQKHAQCDNVVMPLPSIQNRNNKEFSQHT